MISSDNYVLIGSLVGIILSFFIGIAIGRSNCTHRKRNFILNLFKSLSECTFNNPCSCCENVKVHFSPDKRELCEFYVNQIKGEGPQKCHRLPGGSRQATGPCDKLHGFVGEKSALLEIISALRRARKSIDICVYLLTHKHIHDILVALRRKKGIVIRIITDSTDNEEMRIGNQAQALKESGIKVKTNAAAKMHNKFVIVDKQIAILGSTNWTKGAFHRNDEALIKTRQPVIVKAFSDKFKLMWGEMPEYRQPEYRQSEYRRPEYRQPEVRLDIDEINHRR